MSIQRINRTEHVLYDSLEELEDYASPNCQQNNPRVYKESTKAESSGWYGPITDGLQARQKILIGAN